MKKIIICDDDEGILEVVKIVLEDRGFDVSALSDPEKLYALVDQIRPHLILLDLWMPVLNGDAITRELKKKDNTKHIPVIIISANKDTEKIAREVGADSFLAKPFDIERLEQMVDKYIS